MALKSTLVTARSPILCQSSLFAELKRWQPPLFTLSRTTTSTTGLYAPTLGRNSATTPPERPPNGSRRRSRKSARPNSSSTSRTEKRAERVLQKTGPPDCSGDDPAESGDALLHLHAVGMLAGPCQQLRQGHDTGLARNLPAVVHEHQCRYALDGEPPQQFLYGVAVDLDQPQIGFELGCRLFEDRRHRPAGTAPDSPEINQYGNVIMVCLPPQADVGVRRR